MSCRTCLGPDSIESSVRDLRFPEKNGGSNNKVQSGQETSSAGSSSPSSPEIGGRAYQPYKPPNSSGGCASCTFTVPKEIAAKLPSGAPGSPRADGTGTNGSPIMRTKAAYSVIGPLVADFEAEDDTALNHASPTSFTSSNNSSFHEHAFESSTTSTPADPNVYTILRRAYVQTLSCENLWQGQTSGPLSFQDSVNGLTIAYKFTLPDPHARGCRRQYALLAVVGPDSPRGMEAASSIWRVFQSIANYLMTKAEENVKNGQCPAGGTVAFDVSNVSSFLTGRTVDPDGFPRRGGISTRARSLAEIVGNERVFAWLHEQFSLLLLSLAQRFGEVMV